MGNYFTMMDLACLHSLTMNIIFLKKLYLELKKIIPRWPQSKKLNVDGMEHSNWFHKKTNWGKQEIFMRYTENEDILALGTGNFQLCNILKNFQAFNYRLRYLFLFFHFNQKFTYDMLLLLSHFSCVQLCARPYRTAAHQAPPSRIL